MCEKQLQRIEEKVDLLLASRANQPAKTYFSFKEAADYLRISESALYKHTSKGTIRHFKPNGKIILFNREDLDAWVAAHPISPTDIQPLNHRKNRRL